ncbi:MAG: BlaI/MecI/CopY family transcriptional regulator [Gaiellaceae bacterium]
MTSQKGHDDRAITLDAMSRLDRRPQRQRASRDPVVRYLGALQAAVMEIIWRRESATVREVVDELNKKRDLAYTTVLTLVSRLWSRGLLDREPEGRGFRYHAAKSREEFLAELSDELIDRIFADFGAIGVARIGERLDELNAQEKQRLKRRRKQA